MNAAQFLADIAILASIYALAQTIRHVNRHEWLLDRTIGDTSRIRAALRAAGIPVAPAAEPLTKPGLLARTAARLRRRPEPEEEPVQPATEPIPASPGPATQPAPAVDVIGGAKKPSPTRRPKQPDDVDAALARFNYGNGHTR